ncbi:MAG: hypothetical protein ABF649_12340 [Bacillus sp. (in: firmicutes)]
MNEYYRNLCPEWAKEIQLQHDLVLGDDADSLLSCNLLEEITNGLWKVNYFYDFEDIYRANKTSERIIGVDMAFTKQGARCFDNHVSRAYPNDTYNKNCMNLNFYKDYISATKNYYKKYPFSTLMLIMAYYDIPLPKSDAGKAIILAIDSSHKGHYTNNSYFKQIHTDWLELLGFGSLVDILNKRDMAFFKKVQEYFGLSEKVYLNEDGLLKTDIKLELIQPYLDWDLGLSDKKFKLIKQFEREGHSVGEKRLPNKEDIISLAFTGKEYISYTHRG